MSTAAVFANSPDWNEGQLSHSRLYLTFHTNHALRYYRDVFESYYTATKKKAHRHMKRLLSKEEETNKLLVR